MGNRRLRRKNKIRKIIRTIILLIILYILFRISYGFYKENKIRLVEGNYESIIQEDIEKTTRIITEKAHISENYLGFKVAAKLIIPTIELETNILEEYTEEGMDICASKFWGPEPNEIGNFCIVGHNYNKENMFNKLINLKMGDEIYLIDNKNGKITYTIFDIYKVKPQNTSPLDQNTDGKRIITLITCVNYSNTRLIVQALEN